MSGNVAYRWRNYLVLGRVSNLPTVWSNCLAGWWLGGGGNIEKLPLLFVAMTLLYVGGMYLNDAFDVEFDRQHRRERPIPAGKIALRTVWQIGLASLALGAACLLALDRTAGILGLALVACILVYDAIHKVISFSPVIMGLCRFFIYVISAAVASRGVSGWAIWGGLALAAYIVGLSYLARRESTGTALRLWPLWLLGTPVMLALLTNANQFRRGALLLSVVLALWVILQLRPALGDGRNIGRSVTGLLAGIVFVDLLAVVDARLELRVAFLALFGAALLFQRFVPAT